MKKSRFTGNPGDGTTMSAEVLPTLARGPKQNSTLEIGSQSGKARANCAATFHRRILHNPCAGSPAYSVMRRLPASTKMYWCACATP
jgi:hypothetical protein